MKLREVTRCDVRVGLQVRSPPLVTLNIQNTVHDTSAAAETSVFRFTDKMISNVLYSMLIYTSLPSPPGVCECWDTLLI